MTFPNELSIEVSVVFSDVIEMLKPVSVNPVVPVVPVVPAL